MGAIVLGWGAVDVYFVAEAIGATLGLAIGGFFISRKLLGPAGSAELARLKRIAGIEVTESRAALVFRDWAPYLIAVACGVFGFGVMLVKHSATAFAGGSRTNFSTSDLPKMKAGFVHGCENRCASGGADVTLCATLCACVLSGIQTKYASDAALTTWFNSATTDLERMQAELAEAQAECMRPATAP